MKFWIKIWTALEVWGEAIKRWWDTHLCAISRKAATQVVLERDMLRDQLEELEDQDSTEIEKLTQENTYLKDELAYEHMRNKRLESVIKDRENTNFQNIYPGLMAEITSLKETNELLQKAYVRLQLACMDNGVGEEEWYVEAVQPEANDAQAEQS